MLRAEIAPGLLLAMPQLSDPNFSRAVVLMLEHNDEGSFGIIINQPTEVTVEELFTSVDFDWEGPRDSVVWRGGPVRPSQGWMIGGQEPGLTEGLWLPVSGGIVMLSNDRQIDDFAKDLPKHHRFVLGYSGWGPGQLASEMAEGAWLHADATSELIFETDYEDLWTAAITSIGADPSSVVPGSGTH